VQGIDVWRLLLAVWVVWKGCCELWNGLPEVVWNLYLNGGSWFMVDISLV